MGKSRFPKIRAAKSSDHAGGDLARVLDSPPPPTAAQDQAAGQPGVAAEFREAPPAGPYFGLPPLTAALLVVGLAVAVYLNALPNDFVIDDGPQIVENEYLHQPGSLRFIFTSHAWAFAGELIPGNYYRPLMYATWYLLWRISHTDPVGYHALNILLHAFVSLFLFLWLRRMQQDPTVAWLAALLFAVHPIHSEAVAWVSALPDLQCALFFLVGFWLYLVAQQARGWRRYAMLAGVGACVLLALLAKEIGAALPAVVVLHDIHSARRRKRERAGVPSGDGTGAAAPSGLAGRLVLYAVLAISFIAYLVLRVNALGGVSPAYGLLPFAPARYIAAWSIILYEYVVRLLAPWKLNAFSVIAVPATVLSFKAVTGVTVAAGLLGLGAWLHHRRRTEFWAIVIFLLALAPSFLASVRVGGFRMGERYLYLPSVGFCWLLAVALLHGLRRRQTILMAIAASLVLVYAGRTLLRNADWRQEIPFYLHELRGGGDPRQLRGLLASTMLHRGMPEQALEHARAWAALLPDDTRAHRMLAEIYWALENAEEALSESRRAALLAIEQGDKDLAAREFSNLAVLFSQAGRPEQSLDAYREALRLDPNLADAHYNLAVSLLAMGKAAEAAEHFRAAARLSPKSAWPRAYLGEALAALRDFPGARAALAEADRLQPNNAEILARTGDLELAAGDREAARRWFSKALAVQPSNPRAQAGLAAIDGAHRR